MLLLLLLLCAKLACVFKIFRQRLANPDVAIFILIVYNFFILRLSPLWIFYKDTLSVWQKNFLQLSNLSQQRRRSEEKL